MCVCTQRICDRGVCTRFPLFLSNHVHLSRSSCPPITSARALALECASVRVCARMSERVSRRRNELRAKEGESKSGRERERHTKNESALARNNYKKKFSRVKSHLIGCNNGGGGGNFSKVKRLIGKCIRRLKRLFSGFSCFLNKQSYSLHLRLTFPILDVDSD